MQRGLDRNDTIGSSPITTVRFLRHPPMHSVLRAKARVMVRLTTECSHDLHVNDLLAERFSVYSDGQSRERRWNRWTHSRPSSHQTIQIQKLNGSIIKFQGLEDLNDIGSHSTAKSTRLHVQAGTLQYSGKCLSRSNERSRWRFLRRLKKVTSHEWTNASP